MPPHVPFLDDFTRAEFVRMLLPGEEDSVPVQNLKLVINPTFTNSFAALLHVSSMCVYIVPIFQRQGEAMRMSINAKPNDREIVQLTQAGIDPERVAQYMAIAKYWRDAVENHEGDNYINIFNEF